MAARARQFWTSDPVRGPAGTFHIIVSRLAATPGAGGQRDIYSATLVRKGEAGDEPVETDFWQHTSPPHDADKLAFRERARRAATQAATAE